MPDNFNKLAETLNEYGFKLHFLFPVGLYLTDKIVFNYYDPFGNPKVRNKIFDLFGQQRAQEFLKVHTAQKIVFVLAVTFLFLLLALPGQTDYTLLIFGFIAAGLSCYWADRQLDYKLKKKKQSILIDLPGFINSLTLLVGAGLTFNGAVQKIVADRSGRGVLYKELKVVLIEINNGKGINRAYEDFALKCRVPELTRFVSTVLQNINRGSSDMVCVLKVLAQDAWEKRKDVAKKQGEEASSKLVFPMVMIFLAVAIIVLAPAVMTMGM